jgi:hypothetical protein
MENVQNNLTSQSFNIIFFSLKFTSIKDKYDSNDIMRNVITLIK